MHYVLGPQDIVNKTDLTLGILVSTLANSEDPDEMPHYVAFHVGLHCLQRQKQSSGKGM